MRFDAGFNDGGDMASHLPDPLRLELAQLPRMLSLQRDDFRDSSEGSQ